MPAHQDPTIRFVAQERAWSGPGETGVDVRLTRREREVLRLLVARYTDREIADALSISYRTATTHTTRIREKRGICSRREVAAKLDRLHDTRSGQLR